MAHSVHTLYLNDRSSVVFRGQYHLSGYIRVPLDVSATDLRGQWAWVGEWSEGEGGRGGEGEWSEGEGGRCGGGGVE